MTRQGSLFRAVALPCLAATGLLFASNVALAQDAGELARAEALFTEGKKLVDASKTAEACPKFAESQKLVRGVGVTLYLADCYERVGKTASAWAQFRLAESLASSRGDKRSALAHDRAQHLEDRLATLKIIVSADADAPDLEIHQDGAVVGKAQWGVAVPVDPGVHSITAHTTSRSWDHPVTVPATKGEIDVTVPPLKQAAVAATTPVVVPPAAAPATTTEPSTSAVTTTQNEAAPPAPPPQDERPHAGRTQRIVGVGVGALGVVGVAIGSVFGLTAKSDFDNATTNCPGKVCNPTGIAQQSQGHDAAMASNIAFGVGAAAIVGGVVLYLTAPKETHAVTLLPALGPRNAGMTLGLRF